MSPPCRGSQCPPWWCRSALDRCDGSPSSSLSPDLARRLPVVAGQRRREASERLTFRLRLRDGGRRAAARAPRIGAHLPMLLERSVGAEHLRQRVDTATGLQRAELGFEVLGCAERARRARVVARAVLRPTFDTVHRARLGTGRVKPRRRRLGQHHRAVCQRTGTVGSVHDGHCECRRVTSRRHPPSVRPAGPALSPFRRVGPVGRSHLGRMLSDAQNRRLSASRCWPHR